jgi:Adenylate and Guanylate cyclase catalytic domain
VPFFKLPTINTASRYSARVLYGLPDEDLRVFSTAFSMRMRVMPFLRVTSVRRISARCSRDFLSMRTASKQIGLPLRVGVHTGEIEIRGRDIGGIAVHAASRVMTQSQPGEVLVSRVVTDLVAGAGLVFSERGSHELKRICSPATKSETGTKRQFAPCKAMSGVGAKADLLVERPDFSL